MWSGRVSRDVERDGNDVLDPYLYFFPNFDDDDIIVIIVNFSSEALIRPSSRECALNHFWCIKRFRYRIPYLFLVID